jgi:thiazole synthase ThiGH ThiG subunit
MAVAVALAVPAGELASAAPGNAPQNTATVTTAPATGFSHDRCTRNASNKSPYP